MPTTPVYSLSYPSPDDPAGSFPAQVQDLAGDVDAALATLDSDTGVLGTLPFMIDPGWTLNTKQHRIIHGKILSLRISVARAGANITATSVGNITDSLIGTITDASLRPDFAYWVGSYRASFTGGACAINGSNGTIQITSAHSTSVISTGDNVIIQATYGLP